jgi:uncharacterized protein (TIGR02145 family)
MWLYRVECKFGISTNTTENQTGHISVKLDEIKVACMSGLLFISSVSSCLLTEYDITLDTPVDIFYYTINPPIMKSLRLKLISLSCIFFVLITFGYTQDDPDLELTTASLITGQYYCVGEQVVVECTINNICPGAVNTNTNTGVFLMSITSGCPNPTNYPSIGSQLADVTLSLGDMIDNTETQQLSFNIPPGLYDGTYWVVVVTDFENDIPNECLEDNNMYCLPITIEPVPFTPIITGGGTYCDSTILFATGGGLGPTSFYWYGTDPSGPAILMPNNWVIVSTSGFHYFRSCNNICCSNVAYEHVIINTSPSAVTVTGGGTYYDSTTLIASGGSGGTIYWQGTTNGGTSTATPSTTQTVSSSGTYYFRSYGNGCWGPQGSATVIIQSDSNAQDPSAILDLESTTDGVLIPRMTEGQRDSIANKVEGLMIYQTTVPSGFYYYDGSDWKQVGAGVTSSLWQENGVNIYRDTGKVSIGTNNPMFDFEISSHAENESAISVLRNPSSTQNLLLQSGDSGTNPLISFKGSDALRFGYFDGALHELMRIINNGNVGIGLDTPIYKLDVFGTARFDDTVIINNKLIVDGTAKIAVMEKKNSADSVVVILSDGTLARRDVSSLQDQISEKMLNAGLNGIIEDIDGNVYKTIKIGTQVWMAENLNTTRYNDGTAIPLVTDSAAWSNLTTPGYIWHGNDSTANAMIYGTLYNYYVVADTNSLNVCPVGWHVPTDTTWSQLTNFLIAKGYGYGGSGIDIGKSMASTFRWESSATPGSVGNDQGTNNSSGLAVLPAGSRFYNGGFDNIGYTGYWWSSTESSTNNAMCRYLNYYAVEISKTGNKKKYGFSVRCLRD